MKFLVLNYWFKGYTGSEINALQISEALISMGHEAEIGTFFAKPPLLKIARSRGIRVINLLDNIEKPLNYDVIWAHHSPVLAHLLFHRKIDNCRVLFSSLSSFMDLECPPTFHSALPLFLANSELVGNVVNMNEVPQEKIHVFPNFAPATYFKMVPRKFGKTPNRIVVVSNHPPVEIMDFCALARKNGCNVDMIGLNNKAVFVDGEFLEPYDLIISIGKTIFYGFALRIPVYCYDHFGGSGYITPENFIINRTHNFSGRGIDRNLNGEEILHDIFDNYENNLMNVDFLYEAAKVYFHLEKNLQKIIDLIQNLPVLDVQHFRDTHSLDKRVYGLILEPVVKANKISKKYPGMMLVLDYLKSTKLAGLVRKRGLS